METEAHCIVPEKCQTVNVDIFVCISFRQFLKIGNFAFVKNCAFTITASLG